MIHTLPAIMSCPACGADFDNHIASHGNCAQCQSPWERKNNVLFWDSNSNANLNKSWKTLLFNLKNQFHPLSSFLLPFRYLIKYRDEKYYRLTLSDKNLAKSWGNHYLKDTDLKAHDMILDLGCGRGRCVGLANQLGLHAVGQDIKENSWWKNIKSSNFQVVPPNYSKLPWRADVFSAVICVELLHYFTEKQLASFLQEIYRTLKPGGYCILLEANSMSYGAYVTKKQIGRLHTLKHVQDLLKKNGFQQLSLSYEGFFSPIFPLLINFIRQIFSKNFYSFDFESRLEKMLPPEKRRLWLLTLQKPL